MPSTGKLKKKKDKNYIYLLPKIYTKHSAIALHTFINNEVRAPYSTIVWTEHPDGPFIPAPPLTFSHLGLPLEQSHTSWSHPHNSWAKPHNPLPDHPAPSLSKFSSCYFFSPRLMEQTGLPTNHTNARAWIIDVAGKMWQFWLCLCCCHLADQLAHCMIWERVLQCFTCESKQADPFHPQFSKVKLWRDTRKHPYRSNGRGKAYPLKEKQTKPSTKHNYILSLPM